MNLVRNIVRLFLPNITFRSFIKFSILTVVFFAAFSGIFVAILLTTLYDDRNVKNLRYIAIPEPMKVFDRNGKLIAELFAEKRIPVSYSDISPNVINAFISIEDENFFEHRGIDFQRMIKAMVKNILAGKIKEGASTITQQLAKRIFTTGERSITRKILEIWYALQIEREYSKEEILELYLNNIYFGYGVYGVEMASKIYLGKSVSNLTIPESALLAVIPKGPRAYSPFVNIQNTRKRHYAVMKRMSALGYIPEDKLDEIYEKFWQEYYIKVDKLKAKIAENEDQIAPHFVDHVRSVVSKIFGDDAVYRSGLKVYTTIDIQKQILAEKYVKKYRNFAQSMYENNVAKRIENLKYQNIDILKLLTTTIGMKAEVSSSSYLISLREKSKFSLFELQQISKILGMKSVSSASEEIFFKLAYERKVKNQIECALVSIDSKTGYVEAVVGGSEFSAINQFNRAFLAKRQLGSAFKPFLYAAAIDSKLATSASMFVDEPIEYRFQGNVWSPKNYEGNYQGVVTLRTALKLSLNIVSVKLLEKIGLGVLRNYTKAFFDADDKTVSRYINSMAAALGTFEATPLQVAEAFTVFPRGGTRISSIYILRIEDRYGKVLKDFEKERVIQPKQVITSQTAFILNSMMKDAVRSGTGARIHGVGFIQDAAGKTGTTSYWRDAWFIGFTGDGLVTVVWFGFDDSSVSMGAGMVGGVLAAPAFGEYMRDYYKGKTLPPISLNPPSGISIVEVCAESGELPTPFCPKIKQEYFLVGTEPTQRCTIHSKDNQINLELIHKDSKDKDVIEKNELLEDIQKLDKYLEF